MNKIKIALVFENIETAKKFVAINAPNGVVKINSANSFVYDTQILHFYWVKPFVDCRGGRANFVYTTEDIRDTKWFDEVIRPMQIVGTGVIETKVLGDAT